MASNMQIDQIVFFSTWFTVNPWKINMVVLVPDSTFGRICIVTKCYLEAPTGLEFALQRGRKLLPGDYWASRLPVESSWSGGKSFNDLSTGEVYKHVKCTSWGGLGTHSHLLRCKLGWELNNLLPKLGLVAASKTLLLWVQLQLSQKYLDLFFTC